MNADRAADRTSSRWYVFVVLWFSACLFVIFPFGFAFGAWLAWQQPLPLGLPAAGVIRWALVVLTPAGFAASWCFFYLVVLDMRWIDDGAREPHELFIHPAGVGSAGGMITGLCFTLMGIGFLFEAVPNALVIGLTMILLGLLSSFVSLCGYLWASDEAANRA